MTRFLTLVLVLGLSILVFASVGWGAGLALPDNGSITAAAQHALPGEPGLAPGP